MTAQTAILAQIKATDTIIIHRHQRLIQMPLGHNLAWRS